MTEIEDDKIQNFYNITVAKHMVELTSFKDSQQSMEFTRDMGKLGSVQNTKKLLEDLYKRS